MHVAAWPGLSPADFCRPRNQTLPFPLSKREGAFYYVARNAIYHLFRELIPRHPGPVLVPDYHSGNEVWAIRAAGRPIRFYHIDRNLQPDLNEIEDLMKLGPSAMYAIHYMGWPQPIREIAGMCRDRNLPLVEDCALSLLSESDGLPLGTFGDYAVFCLYKTVPVPNGGLLVGRQGVEDRLGGQPRRAPGTTSVAGRSMELLLEWMRNRSEPIGQTLFRMKRGLGSALSRVEVQRTPVGDIGFNLDNVDIGMSSFCRRLLERFDYEEIRATRRRNFELMLEATRGRATPLRNDLDDGLCPLFFPILVREKRRASEALAERGIETIEFWNYGDDEAAGDGSSDAQFLRNHVLELPIHQDVSPARIDHVAEVLRSLDLRFESAPAGQRRVDAGRRRIPAPVGPGRTSAVPASTPEIRPV